MTNLNFNLRGISPEIMEMLKKAAKKELVSVNHLIICLIEKGIGISKKVKPTVYHDLDQFAGTWTNNDFKDFESNTKYFEQIDEDLWK